MTLRANKKKFKARQQRQTLRKGVGGGERDRGYVQQTMF